MNTAGSAARRLQRNGNYALRIIASDAGEGERGMRAPLLIPTAARRALMPIALMLNYVCAWRNRRRVTIWAGLHFVRIADPRSRPSVGIESLI
jgi:hypothetical protein